MMNDEFEVEQIITLGFMPQVLNQTSIPLFFPNRFQILHNTLNLLVF